MDFEFSDAEQAFVTEVDRFIEENRSDEVMDLTRENMAQLVDTPARRAFMKKLSNFMNERQQDTFSECGISRVRPTCAHERCTALV